MKTRTTKTGTELDLRQDAELDALFAAARQEGAAPSTALMGRILADAYDVAEAREIDPVHAPAPSLPASGRIRRALAALGGWPAAATLSAATLAGLWIGYAPPFAVDLPGVTGDEETTLAWAMPDISPLLTEDAAVDG
ncbi:dihydroorotate dehydrogenase [Tropicimonas sp. IMCC34011]|uniref:dihydroorotate dehydrogenase n=1 Tax=Tropicimonas sp. IMCC34011 TaxID=2248759 RepID=UPI000E240796|nr:dihydroorotate dehydrogenase [Tropicimonas sp. IMCC34011]